jgi:membrane protein
MSDIREPSPPPAASSRRDAILDRVDTVQRRSKPAGFMVGVIKKFGDDRAGNLAALIAYYSFFSIFPLLLVLVTILGFVFDGDPGLQQDIVGSALEQVPAVGEELASGSLQGSGVGLVVGIVGALWAGLAAMVAGQNAMNDVWDVPRDARPNFIGTRVRALLGLVVVGVGLLGATIVGQLGPVFDEIPRGASFALFLANLVINVVVTGAAFRVLTARKLSLGEILPGAIIAGAAYFALQRFGAALVTRTADASDTYGVFALVIGLLSWFYLLAQFTVLAAEVNVVRARALWPRSLTGRNLTEADRRAFQLYGTEARFHDEATVEVSFDK